MTQRHRSPWLFAGVLAVAAIGGIALSFLLPRGGTPDASGDASRTTEAAPAATPAAAAPNPWISPAEPRRAALLYDRFETIDHTNGLPSDRVTCVHAEGEDLWVGTDHGLAVRRDGAWKVYGKEQGLAHRYVTAVARDPASGEVWVATLGGVSRISAGGIRTYTQLNSGLMNDVVYHVVVDGKLVWATTGAGASCLDTETGSWVLYDNTNSIMHEPWTYAVAPAPGRTFFALWGGGIVELDHTTGHWREYRDPDGEMEIDLFRDDGPIHEVTSFLAYDEGVLWQASYFGLARYDGRRWRSYLAQDTGLPADFIHHVHARGHTAWISTDQGFAVFDGETCVSYSRQADGRCRVRIWKDGQQVGERTLETAPAHDYVLWAQGGASEVWLATGRGLSHGVAEKP